MTNNATNTAKRVGRNRASVTSSSPVEEAAQLAERAEEILGGYLQPASWATARVARRFRESGDLETVLSLYAQAMADDPQEPAYPWNLASSLDRLQLPDLALVFLRRAIRIGEETGDGDWTGAGVYLGWADVAIRAGEPAMAELAIEKAREADPGAPVERYVRQLRRGRSKLGATEARNDDAARKGTASRVSDCRELHARQ